MRSFFQNKKLTILLAILALGALTVLAFSLRDVQFNAGQPIGRYETEMPPPSGTVGMIFTTTPVKSQLIFWGVLVLLISLIGLLLSPEGRKQLIRLFVRAFGTYWLIYFVMRNYGDRLAALANLNLGSFIFAQSGEGDTNLPPPVFVPPQESPWISYVVSILLIFFLAYAGWRVWVFLQGLPLGREKEEPLEELARIARSSLKDLSQGGDTTDVIMRCYFRMSNVVSDRRKIHRKDSMTPAEFAVRLEQAGLPGDAVQRLTRLFEAVRYGGYRSGPKDVNEAVACLTSILNYCGEPV
ncbi:MAG: DUF4129 domain-containing protein [Anaerolineales bacterium]